MIRNQVLHYWSIDLDYSKTSYPMLLEIWIILCGMQVKDSYPFKYKDFNKNLKNFVHLDSVKIWSRYTRVKRDNYATFIDKYLELQLKRISVFKNYFSLMRENHKLNVLISHKVTLKKHEILLTLRLSAACYWRSHTYKRKARNGKTNCFYGSTWEAAKW